MKINQKISLVISAGIFLTIATPIPMGAQPPIFSSKDYAAIQAKSTYDWGISEFACLVVLWEKESHWNHLADNPISTAYGIAQLLGETSKSPQRQIDKGLRYISSRYTTPCKALAFWKRNYYY